MQVVSALGRARTERKLRLQRVVPREHALDARDERAAALAPLDADLA